MTNTKLPSIVKHIKAGHDICTYGSMNEQIKYRLSVYEMNKGIYGSADQYAFRCMSRYMGKAVRTVKAEIYGR